MKKIIIILVCLAAIIGCAKEIEITKTEFSKKQKYIVENKEDLTEVIVRHQTLGGTECYKADTEDAYALFTGIKKAIYSGISVTDDYWSYKFIFGQESDEKKDINFSFESSYYKEEKDSYELLEFKHMTFDEEDKIECE